MSNLATLPTMPPEAGEGGTTTLPQGLPNKYAYPEFAGFSGERYLKKLLRQILPMALYRTWEIFADHQAIGNDCYLGLSHLAEIAGRALRTMEKNLAALSAKQLMVERAERKVFRGADGSLKSKVVVVKDFSGLYALAHEYHEWLNADNYIASEREIIELVTLPSDLVAKLSRFDNYRRVLYNRLPGPQPRRQEGGRWDAECHAGKDEYSGEVIQAKRANIQETGALPNKYLAKKWSNQVAKHPLKRINEEIQNNTLTGDSFDSAPSSSEKSGKGTEAHAPHAQYQHIRSGDEAAQENSSPQEVTTPQITATRSRAPRRQVMSASHASSDHPLVHSFLHQIEVPFADRNPKGSITRILGIIEAAHLEEPAEVLLCLVRAYTVARDTRAIRPEHWNAETGCANRMPLFCTMVQRFVEARAQGQGWEYTWQQMEQDIAGDELLTQWWSEYQARPGELAGSKMHQVEDAQDTFPSLLVETKQDDMPQESSGASLLQKRCAHLSQTDEEREERAAHARKVMVRLLHMAVPIREPIILWEHQKCGCPLYHKKAGKEVCAHCSPDPLWPEEVLTLISSIREARALEGGD